MLSIGFSKKYFDFFQKKFLKYLQVRKKVVPLHPLSLKNAVVHYSGRLLEERVL